MAGKRHKNVEWSFPTLADGRIESWTYVPIAVLMDIRDELQKLNALLHCHNFTDIPHKLERIKRNTAKKRKPKVTGKPKLRLVARS